MIQTIIRIFGSLRLTVVCLALAGLLVFFGTIAQVEQGLWDVQTRYFRSLLIFWAPKGADWKIPVFPGGYLIGTVLLINLVTSFIMRFGQVKGRLGLLMVHAGLILLVLGQLATDMFQRESTMRLTVGQPMNYSQSSMGTELAVVDTSPADYDQVVAIPQRFLADKGVIADKHLPFTIKVQRFLPNSRLADRQNTDTGAPPATQGIGPRLKLMAAAPAVKLDERNLPSAVVELVTPQGSLGTWLVSLMLDNPQTVRVGEKVFTIALRPTRHYTPYTIDLLKFTHDKYAGSDIPKNFSSRVRVIRPEPREEREVLIKMNNPLRYAGTTYYQSGFDPNNPQVSILQVVSNPSWLAPYFSCVLVTLGLLIQFMSHLLTFVQRKTA